MIKTLHLRSSFDPGGTETLLLNLFNARQNKIQFFLILLTNGEYIAKLNNTNNVYVKKFKKKKLDLGIIFFLFKFLRQYNIKIIHTHQPYELFYAFIIKIFYPSIKIFHHIHLYNPANNWEYYFERFMVYFIEAYISVSHSLKLKLINRGFLENKITVLPNGVKIQLNKNFSNFQNLIKYKNSDFIIGMIGNFIIEKDQITIVRAFNIIRNKIPNLKLIFIGRESIYSEQCKKLIFKKDLNNKVFFLGSLPNAAQWLPIFNLFVFSSKSETFGIALVEAMLSKVPIIASDIDVNKEISKNGYFFDLFKLGDYEELAKKIEWFYFNYHSDKIFKRVSLAYQYAQKEYMLASYIDKLYNLYNG